MAQWHALSRVIRERGGSAKASEPAAKTLRVLPTDGAGCVELFISAPGACFTLATGPGLRCHCHSNFCIHSGNDDAASPKCQNANIVWHHIHHSVLLMLLLLLLRCRRVRNGAAIRSVS